MSETTSQASQPGTLPAEPPQAQLKSRRKLPVVWLVPLVTLLIAGWLIFDTLQKRGPEITIYFEDGIGIKDGGDIRYRGVKVGEINSIGLSANLEKVVVKARLDKSAENLAEEGSKFWIVRPEISLTHVTGLSTIATGSFIAAEPGASTKPATTFEGLAGAPVLETDNNDLLIEFHTPTQGSINAGDPILYREVTVGKVTHTRLTDSADSVKIFATVFHKYAHLVHDNSIFWNASGIDFNFKDLFDASIDFQSIESILAGGIAFVNPPGDGTPVKTGAKFKLLPDRPDELLEEINPLPGLHISLFAEKVGAVSVNDPVYYRDFQVGKVEDVKLAQNAASVEISVLIQPEYEQLIRSNTVFWNASGIDANFGLFSGVSIDVESLRSLIAGGIALATPPDDGKAVEAGHRFNLYDKPQKEWANWAPHIRLPESSEGETTILTDPAAQSTAAGGSSTGSTEEASSGSTEGQATGDQGAEDQANVAPSTPPLPKGITLQTSNFGVRPEAVQEALVDLGFSNITNIQEKGNYIYLDAYWVDRPVKLEIDAAAGRIKELK